MEYFEAIGYAVREEREKQHITQKDLAKQIGYSSTQVWRLENGGIKRPTYRMISQIENVLHVNVQDKVQNFEENQNSDKKDINKKLIRLKNYKA